MKGVAENIKSSDFYHKIQDRVHFLPLLEKMLDSNDTVFKYKKSKNRIIRINTGILSNMKQKIKEFYH